MFFEFEVNGTRYSAWAVGLGVGLMVVSAIGLIASSLGLEVSVEQYAFVFLFAFSVVPTVLGVYAASTWAALRHLEYLEREQAVLKPLESTIESIEDSSVRADPPLVDGWSTTQHERDWCEALVRFLMHARTLDSLLSQDHLGVSVSKLEHWQRLTDILANCGFIIKHNGRPTALAPGWTYNRAIREVKLGYFECPPAYDPPPPVALPHASAQVIEQESESQESA